MATKIILLFESAELFCFKTFYRFLISLLMYKISRFVSNKIFMHSTILDIHFYCGICVTLVKVILCLKEVCGHFHNKSLVLLFLFQIKEKFCVDFLFCICCFGTSTQVVTSCN